MGIDIDDPDPGDRTGDVTLVFSLGAARRLSDPEAAIANARKWSRHVGIVANDADAVERFVRETGVENDYTLRTGTSGGRSATSTRRAALPGGVRRRVDCEPSRRDPRRLRVPADRRGGREGGMGALGARTVERIGGDQSPVAGAESAARLIDGGDTARERSRTAIDERERRLAIAPTRRLDRSRSTRPCSPPR